MNDTIPAKHICFIGAGSMAEAIIKGLIAKRLFAPGQISAVNRSDAERLRTLSASYGITIPAGEADKETLVTRADVVVLAMKPKDAAQALGAIGPLLQERQLIISVIAGLTISSLTKMLGKPLAIARTMPNTSSMIGLGATGICYSDQVTAEQRLLARTIFESVGIVHEADEPLLNIVTGVSGSGPAYIYYIMEAMIQGGIEGGLSPQAAEELTVQTVLGAAMMVRQTGEKPEELRRKVTSPGGTTQAAIELMDSFKVREAVTRAVKRAAERAEELGSMLDKT